MERPLKTEAFSLRELIDGIENGEITLADFQRDFDWSPTQVRSMLATVLMGWPAGSLLMIRGELPDLQQRPFVGGPESLRHPARLVVLDGQQRLTALFHALSQDQPSQYVIDLDALARGGIDDIEDGISARPRENAVVLPGIFDGQIPLEVVRSPETFFEWRDQVTLSSVGRRSTELDRELSTAYRTHLHWLHDYPFASVLVDSEIDEPSVARIFERLNRSGMRLGSFDLVVARAYARDWNLRTRWEEAYLEYPLLWSFLGDDGLPVLQSLSLVKTRDVRQRAVLELDPDIVKSGWSGAVDAVERSLRFLVESCGVVRSGWLPYRAMLVVLAGLAFERDLKAHENLLRAWFFTRGFGQRFDAAANTRIVADYELLQTVMNSRERLPNVDLRSSTLLGATRQGHAAIWRTFLCALAFRDAHDLDGASLRLGDLPVDVDDQRQAGPLAVPVALLSHASPEADAERVHLRVLNIGLAGPETVTRIRRESRDRLARVPLLPWPAANDAHQAQFLPNACEIAEPLLDWRVFLVSRLQRLEQWLTDEFGQKVRWDEMIADETGSTLGDLEASDPSLVSEYWHEYLSENGRRVFSAAADIELRAGSGYTLADIAHAMEVPYPTAQSLHRLTGRTAARWYRDRTTISPIRLEWLDYTWDEDVGGMRTTYELPPGVAAQIRELEA